MSFPPPPPPFSLITDFGWCWSVSANGFLQMRSSRTTISLSVRLGPRIGFRVCAVAWDARASSTKPPYAHHAHKGFGDFSKIQGSRIRWFSTALCLTGRGSRKRGVCGGLFKNPPSLLIICFDLVYSVGMAVAQLHMVGVWHQSPMVGADSVHLLRFFLTLCISFLN